MGLLKERLNDNFIQIYRD